MSAGKRTTTLLLTFLIALALVPLLGSTKARAAVSPLSVELLSPTAVKDVPGVEKTVKARITNTSDQALPDVMAYITLADLGKHMTVNLEDYSADKPVTIGTLKAGESRTVDLPIRFVYVSRYYLYVTAVSSENSLVQSSKAIPVEIYSNSKMDPFVVEVVTFSMPGALLVLLLSLFVVRYRRSKAMAS